jgi:hypothetical protein
MCEIQIHSCSWQLIAAWIILKQVRFEINNELWDNQYYWNFNIAFKLYEKFTRILCLLSNAVKYFSEGNMTISVSLMETPIVQKNNENALFSDDCRIDKFSFFRFIKNVTIRPPLRSKTAYLFQASPVRYS